ncbi:MAG: EamA family transporter [Clostridia bacterium]|nr:EamA family transporter [Clostridia bacterium]
MDRIFRKFSALCIVLAAVLWGIIGIFVRSLSAKGLGSAEIMLVRTAFATVGIFLYLALFDRDRLRVKIKDLWLFFGTGIVSFLTFGCAYFATIEMTSVSTAAVLLYTSPIFVTLMAAVFFGEKLTAVKLTALAAAVAGCVLVSGGFGGEAVGIKGLLCGLLSGFCYGLYSIFGRVASKKYSAITVTAYTFLFATAGGLFVADLPKTTAVVLGEPAIVPYLILFALATAVVPYILYTGGLKYTPAGKAAVIACAEPVVAAIIGTAVFGDKMTVGGILGTLLILGAILILNKTIWRKTLKTNKIIHTVGKIT